MQIIPAILTNNPQELQDKIALVEGLVSRVQIDIIDGVFANNKTVDLGAVGNLETSLFLDVHLMTKEPVDWIEKSVRAMTHLHSTNGLRRGEADRIIGQVELMSDQIEFVENVQKVAHSVGFALDLNTPVSAIDPLLLNNLDVILIMSVKAGLGGQKFNTVVIEKVKELSKTRERDSNSFRICVDGGVGTENIKMIQEAGADEVVVGQSLFDGDVEENLASLRAMCDKK